MSGAPWMGIEIRHLVTLVTVAHAGSFKGAGEELGYVQSAVSAQIAQLEALVGVALIDRRRGAKKIGLTAAGRRLAEHVNTILAHVTAAKADLTAVAHPDAARLRVGVVRPVVSWLVPPIMARVAAERPAVSVTLLDTATSGELHDAIAQGTLDVAIAELPRDPGPFESRALAAQDHVLVRARDAGAAPIDESDLEALARLPLIVSTTADDPSGIESLLAAHGVRARVRLRVDSHLKARALACDGLGVAVVPRPVAAGCDPGVEVIGLPAALRPRAIALVWHRERQQLELGERFCALAADAVAEVRGRLAAAGGAATMPRAA